MSRSTAPATTQSQQQLLAPVPFDVDTLLVASWPSCIQLTLAAAADCTSIQVRQTEAQALAQMVMQHTSHRGALWMKRRLKQANRLRRLLHRPPSNPLARKAQFLQFIQGCTDTDALTTSLVMALMRLN